MSVRVYIALRGSDSHEAYNRLQFFLGVGRIAYQIEITGNPYYCLIVFIMYYSFNKTLEIGL